MKNKKKDITYNSIDEFATTHLYGKTAIDYVQSDEYVRFCEHLDKDDNKFIDSTDLDEDCAEARDSVYESNEVLEISKINAQSASHRRTNKSIEELAKRELCVIDIIEEMIAFNENFIKEVLE